MNVSFARPAPFASLTKGATILAALTLIGPPALAQTLDPEVEAFVQSNVLGIFYHELGHALIDLENVPIFGQEEDAADVFSVVMTVAVFEPETALELAYDYALGFDAEARAREDAGEDIAWWDVHGPDEQRFYNTVCLFHGSDPETFDYFAEDMGLPEDRAEYCPDEYAQAEESWWEILDRVIDRKGGSTITYSGPKHGLVGEILSEEVAALNAEMKLSHPLDVTVAPCGEANAYYDPQDAQITFCTEFVDHLVHLAKESL
ncbi:MAG: DUF4344 domain-containing metallopeptidase [Thalassovita sp.]